MSFAWVISLQSTLRHLAASGNQRLPGVCHSLNVNSKTGSQYPPRVVNLCSSLYTGDTIIYFDDFQYPPRVVNLCSAAAEEPPKAVEELFQYPPRVVNLCSQ